MKQGLRQSMAWLHTWSGVALGWLRVAIFLTGTIAYFRQEVTFWMQPELHGSQPSPDAAIVALQTLEQIAPGAESWSISLPTERVNTLGIAWRPPGAPPGRRGMERAELDAGTGEVLKARRRELAALATAEMGKLAAEALAEVDKSASACLYYADHAAGYLRDVPVGTGAARSYVAYEPIGCVLAIMPWNFPYWQVFRFLAPGLMAGNVALLKHATNVPRCADAIAGVLREAGVPDGVFGVLHIDNDQAAQVIADPRVKAVTLTSTTLAPLARADLRDQLDRQVRDSVAAGARVLLGGTPGEGDTAYPATVLDGVAPGMPAYHEELFGPVASLLRVRDEDEAVRVANDTAFGLGASVWTTDRARGDAVARRIAAGACFVNALVRSDVRLPFGGTKSSGFGRELAEHGIHEFTNIKSVYID